MKLSKKLFIIVLIVSLTFAGCSSKNKDIVDNNSSKDQAIKTSETETTEVLKDTEKEVKVEPRTKIVDPFLENFPSDATDADLGIYIRNNIANASTDEAENMIKWLIIYQIETMNEFDQKIWQTEYMDALNDDLDGVVDKSTVNNIQDENVKNDFINLIDAFLYIQLYEGYPVTETNWSDLFQYSAYVSDDFKEMLRICKKISNYEYDWDVTEEVWLPIAGISEDIIIVEGILDRRESTFITWQSTKLYESLLSYLLIGAEGNVDIYEDKNAPIYKSLMQIKSKYPDSMLKDIIAEIDSIEIEDSEDIWEIISRKFQFGLDSDSYFKVSQIKNLKGQYDLLEISMKSNMEKQNRINNMIKIDIEDYIQKNTKNKPFDLTINNSVYANGGYISYNGYLTLQDSSGNDEYFYLYRNLDYIEEKFITIEDYFEADFNVIQNFIEEVSGRKIEALPEFELSGYGMSLTLGTGADDYLYLNYKDLLKYFTLEELLGKK